MTTAPAAGCHFVVVGEVLLDVIASAARTNVHGRISVRPGGTASNAALAARALGAAATVVARIGADQVGALLRQSLEAEDVRLELATDPERQTGCYVQIGSTIVVDRGASATLRAADVEGLEGDAVLVSGFVLLHDDTASAGQAALAASARWRGADVGAASLAARVGSDRVLERLAGANVIFADEAEAAVLTGLAPDAAAAALARSHEIAVVKMGADGAVAASESRVVHAPAPAVQAAAAVVGAGDALDAGVLVGLAAGRGLEGALALGIRAAGWAIGR